MTAETFLLILTCIWPVVCIVSAIWFSRQPN
ncbi:nitrate reductase NapE component [Agrobacterium sp. RC10-4-1]|nr:nitrate reductase NapE component [Agrobacterium sp. RC10-4-1]MDP9775971.1 nitrate reductase NapE component [Rhizobium sp. SORGH_AS_0755]